MNSENNYRMGFANKFYTLWTLCERLVDIPNGKSEVVQEYRYLKNISTDRAVAEEKYPNVPYDEELKGKSGSFTLSRPVAKKVEYAPDVYHFGKYEGKTFEEAGDVEYAAWFWGKCGYYNRECKQGQGLCLKQYLEKHGYVFERSVFEYDGSVWFKMLTPDDVKFIGDAKSEHKAFVDSALAGNPISVVPSRNLDENGNYIVTHALDVIPDIIYHFDETKEMWYNGYYYWLPVLKGKAKRFKCKNIVIDDYSAIIRDDGSLSINVKSFKVEK